MKRATKQRKRKTETAAALERLALKIVTTGLQLFDEADKLRRTA